MNLPRPNSIDILVVDDDRCTCAILETLLGNAGYKTTIARDGQEAWEILDREPQRFHAILLDVMMPRLSGLELLRRIKDDHRLRMIPVILATALASRESVIDGLNAGAYYYLTKPFDISMVGAVVRTATSEYLNHLELLAEVAGAGDALRFLAQGRFVFRTLGEGEQISRALSRCCPDPAKAVIGLAELCINAVEHGNLGVTYDEKSAFHSTGDWQREIERRMALPQNAEKAVTVDYLRTASEIKFTIRDDGQGFDWQLFDAVSLDRIFDAHGRGIMIARTVSFDSVTYNDRGNEVSASVSLQPGPAAEPAASSELLGAR